MDIERKTFPFELDEKGLDPEARTFQGYASIFGNVDEGGDVIVKGAFKKTLAEMGDRVKVYFIHDFMQPIGRLLEAREVPRSQLPARILERAADATGGLFVKGYISETSSGNDALTLMRDAVLDEMSIGYKAIKEDMKDSDDGEGVLRYLKEVKLLDVSPVPLAMNPAALVTSVKAMKVEETDEYIRVPVPGESGKHKDHKIRWITVSAEKGIKALYCVDCKKIITYVFMKEKDWTVEKAKEWVKEHAKDKAMELTEGKFAGSPKNRWGTHSSGGFKGNYAAAWKCHFSKVGGGGTGAAATGPIRGTVRRTEMIAAAMQPKCTLPGTDSISARTGPKSPLKCEFPSTPSDYGLSKWDSPEGDKEKEAAKLSCKDLAVIKRAALAEVKRRAKDREESGKDWESDEPVELVDEDPLLEDIEKELYGRIEEPDELEEAMLAAATLEARLQEIRLKRL